MRCVIESNVTIVGALSSSSSSNSSVPNAFGYEMNLAESFLSAGKFHCQNEMDLHGSSTILQTLAVTSGESVRVQANNFAVNKMGTGAHIVQHTHTHTLTSERGNDGRKYYNIEWTTTWWEFLRVFSFEQTRTFGDIFRHFPHCASTHQAEYQKRGKMRFKLENYFQTMVDFTFIRYMGGNSTTSSSVCPTLTLYLFNFIIYIFRQHNSSPALGK